MSKLSSKLVPGGCCGIVALPLNGTTPDAEGTTIAGLTPDAAVALVANANAVNPVVSRSTVIEETVALFVTLSTRTSRLFASRIFLNLVHHPTPSADGSADTAGFASRKRLSLKLCAKIRQKEGSREPLSL